MTTPKWLGWVQQIQALAQNGLAYSQNPFDIERYKALRELAARLLAEYGQADFDHIHSLYTKEAGYATPKLDARGVVFRDAKLLMVKELADGNWTLPGGWVDVGEPLSLAVEREVREESGYEVKATKILALFDRNADIHGHPPYIFHLYKIFVLCKLLGGEPTLSIETAGVEWVSEDEIPPLSEARTTREEILRLFEHLRSPHLPTEFD